MWPETWGEDNHFVDFLHSNLTDFWLFTFKKLLRESCLFYAVTLIRQEEVYFFWTLQMFSFSWTWNCFYEGQIVFISYSFPVTAGWASSCSIWRGIIAFDDLVQILCNLFLWESFLNDSSGKREWRRWEKVRLSSHFFMLKNRTFASWILRDWIYI